MLIQKYFVTFILDSRATNRYRNVWRDIILIFLYELSLMITFRLCLAGDILYCHMR